MTKVRPKEPEAGPLISFKNEKEKKFFTLILFDLVLLCAIMLIVPSIALSIILCLGIIYLLVKHLKSYHLATKESGDIS